MWENWGIFSGLFGIIEVRPSAGVCRWSDGHTERGEKKRREIERGVLGQVWFPLDQRPGVGLFVQAERPKGEQRQPDVAPPNPNAIEGVSAAVLHSLAPPVLVPFCASLHSTHPYGTKSKRVF